MGGVGSCTYAPNEEATESIYSIKPEVKEEKTMEEIIEIMGEWSLEQDHSLLMLQKIHRNNWSAISRNVHHTSPQVEARYAYLLKNPPPENVQIISEEEEGEPGEYVVETTENETIEAKPVAEEKPDLGALYLGKWFEDRGKREGSLGDVLGKVGLGYMKRNLANSQQIKFMISRGTEEKTLKFTNLGRGADVYDNLVDGFKIDGQKTGLGEMDIEFLINAERIIIKNHHKKHKETLLITRTIDGDVITQIMAVNETFVKMTLDRNPI